MKLYAYPAQAKIDRLIPKTKFYEKGSANSKIERLFVEQVDSIRWAYKLSASTIHIQDTEQLKEIQVFQVKSRVADLDDSILHFIDKAIHMPIIFEVMYQDKIKVYATYKRLNQADHSKVVLDQYYSSEWLDGEQRENLPLFLNLAALYEHLIGQLLPIQPQSDGENGIEEQLSIEQKLQKSHEMERIQKEIASLKAKLKREKQFNRKVEISEQIYTLEQRLKVL